MSNTFPSIYSYKHVIKEHDCHADGRLLIENLLRIIEDTASTHASLGKVNFEDLSYYQQAWVLYQWQLHIYQLPKADDTIQITTWVQEMKGAKSLRLFEIYLNNERVIEMHTLWLIMNTKSRKLEFLKVDGSLFLQHNQPKKEVIFEKQIPSDWEDITRLIVKNEHIDFVGHVNNIQYVKWCLQVLDNHPFFQKNIQKIHVQFAKESLIDEELVLHQNNEFFKITCSNELRFWMKLEMN